MIEFMIFLGYGTIFIAVLALCIALILEKRNN